MKHPLPPALPRVQKVFTVPFRDLFEIWEELARQWTDHTPQQPPSNEVE